MWPLAFAFGILGATGAVLIVVAMLHRLKPARSLDAAAMSAGPSTVAPGSESAAVDAGPRPAGTSGH